MFQSSESGPPGEIGEGGDIGETVTCLIALPNKNVCVELSRQRTKLDIRRSYCNSLKWIALTFSLVFGLRLSG